jgi:hypothetical protein
MRSWKTRHQWSLPKALAIHATADALRVVGVEMAAKLTAGIDTLTR